MALHHHTPRLAATEEAVIVLFCLIDDAYRVLNPRGDRYGALKRLSDSEIVTLALVQQLRGTESQRSFLRDAERFFLAPFPRHGRPRALLAAPEGTQAQALLGALA